MPAGKRGSLPRRSVSSGMSDPLRRVYPVPGIPVTAVLRPDPEDFEVTELLPFGPSGDGEHVWLRIEKSGLNTEEVAKHLARLAGLPLRDIGYAGLKDRHAVARQVFTLPVPPGREPDWQNLEGERLKILEVGRHHRKLRRGILQGNRFRLRLREVSGSRADWEVVLSRLGQVGFPNYFGAQRFGRDNLASAGRMLKGDRRGRMAHHLRSLLWSAARSALFNLVLARRVEQDSWNCILPGEIVQLAGSRSQFPADPEDGKDLQTRLDMWDVHPTGPLPGKAAMAPSGVAGLLEQEVLEAWPGFQDSPGNGVAWAQALAAQGLEASRRALRSRPENMQVQWTPGQELVLDFFLPSGAFATVCLEAMGVSCRPARDGRLLCAPQPYGKV